MPMNNQWVKYIKRESKNYLEKNESEDKTSKLWDAASKWKFITNFIY